MKHNWLVEGCPPTPLASRDKGTTLPKKDCNTMDSKTEFQAVEHNQTIILSSNGKAVLVTSGGCTTWEVVSNAILNIETGKTVADRFPTTTKGGAS